MIHPFKRPCLFVAAALSLAAPVRAGDALEFFLEKHCLACHGPEKEKGDLRIDTLSRDFQLGADSHLWAEVLEQVNSGAMPPKKEKRPGREEIAAFVSTLDSLVKQGKAARLAARPPVALYRLSRTEYQNTVHDLLGVRYDPTQPGELNEDSLWHGYERIGSELTLSPSHVDRYFRAAETVLERAFPAEAKSEAGANKVRKTAADLRYGGGARQQEALDRLRVKRPLRYLLFPGRTQTALSPSWFGQTGPRDSGLYRVRLQASGIRPPGGQPAHLSIGKSVGAGREDVEALIDFDITAPEDEPEIYEQEILLEMPVDLQFCVVATEGVDARKGAAFRNALTSGAYLFTHSSEPLLLDPNAPQMFDDEGNGLFSTVILDWIEWEGPLVSESETSLLQNVLPPDDASPETVAEHLLRFTERAWRRPVEVEEVEQYLRTYHEEREAGETVAESFRSALLGVLTSRNFFYLVEGGPEPREQLNQAELATRLSYFLWSSMPDGPLLAAAKKGSLAEEGLGRQVDRMLEDGKSDRFVEDFTRQWLQLHRLGMFPPDKKLYPSYDRWLETSLRREPVEFFREMFVNDLPIVEFIDSDWTVANARVTAFYGLPEPETDGFQRVSLRPEHQRGGLLTMGAVLGLSSDGTRHRPVHRGVWLSEAIFNKTPPPPPANVDPIEPVPPQGEKITIRQRLEVHAKDANCAACHGRIDPLGFAWDNYDAIGKWRTRERVESGKGEDPPVDASGALPDGRSFANAREFKQLLLADSDALRRAFIEHLCTYALRRVLTVDDQEDIDRIATATRTSGLKDIVRTVALSELLRKR